MATNERTEDLDARIHAERNRWLELLSSLVAQIREWATDLDWSVKDVPKVMQDSTLGRYQAPGLLLQKDFTKLLLEPIARAAPGTEGVVDLYLMPGLDDIASLYYYGGGWKLHYMAPNSPTVATIRDASARPLTKEVFQDVVEEMTKNAV